MANYSEDKIQELGEKYLELKFKAGQRYSQNLSTTMDVYTTFIIVSVSGFLASAQIYLHPELIPKFSSANVKTASHFLIIGFILLFLNLSRITVSKWLGYRSKALTSYKQLENLAKDYGDQIKKIEEAENSSKTKTQKINENNKSKESGKKLFDL